MRSIRWLPDMNSKKAKAIRKMSRLIADDKKLSPDIVYDRLKKISYKNKKLKIWLTFIKVSDKHKDEVCYEKE